MGADLGEMGRGLDAVPEIAEDGLDVEGDGAAGAELGKEAPRVEGDGFGGAHKKSNFCGMGAANCAGRVAMATPPHERNQAATGAAAARISRARMTAMLWRARKPFHMVARVSWHWHASRAACRALM